MPEIAVAGFVSGVRNQIGQYIERGERACHDAVVDQLQESAILAQVQAPVKTGQLKNSIGYRMTGEYEGVVEATAAHAAPQEFGAGPHSIGAPGQTLFNPSDSSGSRFFAKGPVQHPGNPPVGFLASALDAAEAGLLPKLRRNWPG